MIRRIFLLALLVIIGFAATQHASGKDPEKQATKEFITISHDYRSLDFKVVIMKKQSSKMVVYDFCQQIDGQWYCCWMGTISMRCNKVPKPPPAQP